MELICQDLFFYALFFHGLKGEDALGDVAEDGGDDADEGVRCGCGHIWQAYGKHLDEDVGKEYEANGGEGIPEKLDAAMEVRLRENDVARHNKASRETDTKGYNVGHNPGCDDYAGEKGNILLMEYEVISQIIYQYIQHGIRPTAREVAKGLRRDDTDKWPVTKVYDRQYDISYGSKQMLKIGCKGKANY